MNSDKMIEVYPKYESNKDYYDKRIESVKNGFIKHFKSDTEISVFSAPGRIEIGGNHTDHQKGCVLAAAIDLDVLGAASKRDDNIVNLYSVGYDMLTVNMDDLEVDINDYNTTGALIKGVYYKIQNMGYDLNGVDIYCTSDVLGGSGLSSSAAFEVFFGTILNHLYCDSEITAVEIAAIGQYAETVYFGKPCGLMDQTASSVGGVVSIDFKDTTNPIIEKVDLSFEDMKHAVCIIDSGGNHADLTGEYEAITKEMGAVAALFGKKHLREVSKNQIISAAVKICTEVNDRAFLRAIHFQNDNEFAVLEAKALKEKNYQEFLRLVNLSGDSSFKCLQNIYASNDVLNQKVSIALALCKEFLHGRGACRVHGGGFAGTVEAFVPIDMIDEFKKNIEKIFGENSCYILSVRHVGGARIL